MRNIIVVPLLALALSGCGARFGETDPPPIYDGAADASSDTSAFDVFVPVDTTPPFIEVDGSGRESSLECPPGTTQCTDNVDNDGDGLIDWMDPECTSPLDRDEASFATGIPGDNIDPCKQDCWFDGNSGSANDGCNWQGKCLSGVTDPKCPYSAVAAADPTQCPGAPEKCRSVCRPLTPNGCDCAGCCDVFDPLGHSVRVRILSTCTTETLGDATKCPRCEKLPDCEKPCGRCDYCLGKLTIPSDCPDADKPACPAGAQHCDPTNPCPCGEYCLTGCCVRPFG